VSYGKHVERLLAVATTPNGARVIYGGYRDVEKKLGSSLQVVKSGSLEHVATITMPTPCTALVCPDDESVLAGGEDGSLRLFDLVGHELWKAEGTRAVRSLAVHGGTIAAVGDDGTLRLYARAGSALTPKGERSFGPRPLRAVAIDPRGEKVAVGGVAGSVVVVSIGLEGDAREMAAGEGVGALAFTGDGRVAAGCDDGKVRLFYLEGAPDPEDRSRDQAHERRVVGLVVGPELRDENERPLPRRIYSLGEDGTLKNWELDSRRRPKTEDPGGKPQAMAWAAPSAQAKDATKSGRLITVGTARRVQSWPLDRSGVIGAKVALPSRLAELAKARKSKGDDARKAALDDLSRLPEDYARQLLEKSLLEDRQETIRAHAATLLSRTARRRSRPALRQALDDGRDKVRKAALDALTSLEKDNPFAAARAALRSKHADMRRVALARLPMMRDASPLVPGLIAGALADGDADVRKAALAGLYLLEGTKKSLEPVRIAFARGPADVRRLALVELSGAQLATDEEGERIVEGAFDDDDAGVRSLAFEVAVAARPRLAKFLSQMEGFTQKLEALKKAGGHVGSEDGAPGEDERAPLFAALTARHVDVAILGAWALGVLADPRGVGAYLQLSRDSDPSVRRSVIGMAQHTLAHAVPGSSPLRGRIEWLLDDDDKNVRTSAYEALLFVEQSRGAAGVLDVAELALRCKNADQRLRALQALVKFGGEGEHAGDPELAKRADGLLGDALDDEDPKVRDEAFRTLWAWHTEVPEMALSRAARSRHPDLRLKVAKELLRQADQAWAKALLVELAGDADANVGTHVYTELLKDEENRTREDLHRAALFSPAAKVVALACAKVDAGSFASLRPRVLTLVEDARPTVHLAAIQCFDRLKPGDEMAFVNAFASPFYELRTKAIELCGRRRDRRCVEPAQKLLAYPEGSPQRPQPAIRMRVARALADVGHLSLLDYFAGLLEDGDPNVREMGARGLATAARPGREQHLVDALDHADLAVRSWVAEGLARLGDPRSLPVLAGTLAHDHRPIRLGAIMGFVALGPEGVRGLLMGLDDADRDIQDLVFGVIVARDLALAGKDLPPDLAISALSSTHPEVRFAAARFLESRAALDDARAIARELVGPRKLDRAADMKDWPEEERQAALLNVLVDALASDDPAQRYAAAQVVALRTKPKRFWSEASRLQGPYRPGSLRIPHTNWADEPRQPRKRDWLRRLLAGSASGGDQTNVMQLVFGVYAGLVRQAPLAGEADETHRIRRDALARIAQLGEVPSIGRAAVLPVLRRALSDPHHLVRRAAVSALQSLYGEGDRTPLRLMLQSSAPDMGRQAVDTLVDAARDGDAEAKQMVVGALDAPVREVRSHALGRLPGLYESGSLEPFLVALGSRHPDVRSSVVDRLVGSADERVADALGKAMESEHQDLQLKAAGVLARRGDARTVEVLAGLLRSENANNAAQALRAMETLAAANRDAAAPVAEAIVARMEDDPEGNAMPSQLLPALGRIGSTAAGPHLFERLEGEDKDRIQAYAAVVQIAKHARGTTVRDRVQRQEYDEAFLLEGLRRAAKHVDPTVRLNVPGALRDVQDTTADGILAELVEDRDEAVRVAAANTLAFRAEHGLPDGSEAKDAVSALREVLRVGRRELTLPAAKGLAAQGASVAFQSLVLVLKAGEQQEREKAVLALGTLGDPRGLEELLPLADPTEALEPEDAALTPASVEALGRTLPRLEAKGPREDAERVRELVERLARTGPVVLRMRAITGLRVAGDDRSRGLFEKFAGDAHEEDSVRRHAVVELGKLGNEASEAALGAALESPMAPTRREARAALQKIFPDDPTRVALMSLRSAYDDIAGFAGRYLARHGDPAVLLGRLAEVKPAVRQKLRTGLIRRGVVPVASLGPLLRGDATGVRAEAAWMAGAAADASIAADVAEAVKRSREDAVEGRGKPKKAPLLSPENAWYAALWAAGRVKADVLDEARAAVADREAPVRVRAEATRRLGDARGATEEDLRPLLTDVPEVRRIAGVALARLVTADRATQLLGELSAAHADAIAPLAEKATKNAPAVLEDDARRRFVLGTLLGKSRYAELIAKAHAPGEATSKLAAIAALGRTPAEEARGALQALLDREGEPESVRKMAFKALRRAQRQQAKRERYEEAEA